MIAAVPADPMSQIEKMISHPDLSLETPLWQAGLTVGGIDEAGRGAWAGPVAAGAVILPMQADILQTLSGVRDSKCMTPLQRKKWAEQIKITALGWAVGFASSLEIDELGIVRATRMAMQRAVDALPAAPDHLLLDAVVLREVEIPQTILFKGDAISISISAASVLAKTHRDEGMIHYEQDFPGYGFAQHKGYGTRLHRACLDRLGPCPIHRASFRPVRDFRL
ncbi:MAG: ribonuclease HII [Chloroflexi bacterium]|nr:ribonuclease HII [Chloroflexota bacterium]